jgi:hypothetical protein
MAPLVAENNYACKMSAGGFAPWLQLRKFIALRRRGAISPIEMGPL